MRGSWTDENDKVTLFSAMLHREAVTIAQVRVPDGTNEITQADAILDTVEIPAGESALVTLDAAHTQRETAEYIGGKPGWDFLMTVKGNQPSLQRDVFDKILPLLAGTPHDVTEEHDRGRIKRRSCWITSAEGIDFPHARQAAIIRREIFEISGGRISKEHALILTSRKAEKMTAADVNRHIRGHWGIENKSHYVRDTVGELAAAFVLLTAFALKEQRSKNPLLPLSIFRVKGLAAADITPLIGFAGFIAAFFFLTLYMQNVLGYSPVKSGLAFLPAAIGVGVVARISPRLIGRLGTRPLLLAGSLTAAGGIYWLSRIPVNGSYPTDLLPGMMIMSFGLGAQSVAATIAANAGMPADKAGLTTAR